MDFILKAKEIMVGFQILPLNFKVNSDSKISQGIERLVRKCHRRAVIWKETQVKGQRTVYSEMTGQVSFNNGEMESQEMNK